MPVAAVRRLLPIGVLYGGRVGIAALGLVVLPWLSRVMPAGQFGLVATVLALQTLAVVFDLGLSITISREFPVITDARNRRDLLRSSERALLALYGSVTVVVAGLAILGVLAFPPSIAALVCLSLLLVVWQNLLVIGFIARQQFFTSTLVQFISLLLRHGCSLAFVVAFEGTVKMFVLGQIAGAALILGLSRLVFAYRHRSAPISPTRARLLGTTNMAVMIYTIAGACALQLDKVLLSALASPVDTGPYYLASTLSLVPITFLASPVSQFVQPKLIAALDTRKEDAARRWIGRLTLAIILLAVLPGIALGLAAPWLVPLWLHGAPQQAAVSRYATLLMPGASIGALGLVPAIVLIARRDYRAMALISGVLATAILSSTAWLAAHGTVAAVCVTYAIYHVAAAAGLWWRAVRVEPCFAGWFAIRHGVANEGAERPVLPPAS